MSHSRLYTYGEKATRTIYPPQDPFMAAGYAAGLPGVRAAVKARAEIGAAVARSVLAAHQSGQDRSSDPKIKVVAGDRTDYHVLLEVRAQGGKGDPDLAAAYSIEYGRRSYVDSKGRRQPATHGVYALTSALVAMGGV